jgi:hypothetical protein
MSNYRYRNMNAELRAGSTDGTVKKIRPDTADLPANTAAIRKDKQALNPNGSWNSYGEVLGGSEYVQAPLG